VEVEAQGRKKERAPLTVEEGSSKKGTYKGQKRLLVDGAQGNAAESVIGGQNTTKGG